MKLKEALQPAHLEVIDESSKHNVPAVTESHFKVVVVSDLFLTLTPIQRQRRVNEILSEELRQSIHALSMVTKTLQEWETANGRVPDSPPCLGGSKRS